MADDGGLIEDVDAGLDSRSSLVAALRAKLGDDDDDDDFEEVPADPEGGGAGVVVVEAPASSPAEPAGSVAAVTAAVGRGGDSFTDALAQLDRGLDQRQSLLSALKAQLSKQSAALVSEDFSANTMVSGQGLLAPSTPLAGAGQMAPLLTPGSPDQWAPATPSPVVAKATPQTPQTPLTPQPASQPTPLTPMTPMTPLTPLTPSSTTPLTPAPQKPPSQQPPPQLRPSPPWAREAEPGAKRLRADQDSLAALEGAAAAVGLLGPSVCAQSPADSQLLAARKAEMLRSLSAFEGVSKLGAAATPTPPLPSLPPAQAAPAAGQAPGAGGGAPPAGASPEEFEAYRRKCWQQYYEYTSAWQKYHEKAKQDPQVAQSKAKGAGKGASHAGPGAIVPAQIQPQPTGGLRPALGANGAMQLRPAMAGMLGGGKGGGPAAVQPPPMGGLIVKPVEEDIHSKLLGL